MNEDMLFATEEQQRAQDPSMAEPAVETQKFLIFMTDDLKFGVDVNLVIEIFTNYTITYLPMLPDFIRGIINVRGQMIPILDIRLHLGKPERDDCVVVILSVNGAQIGIYVDAVDQMIDIPKTAIQHAPANSVHRLVSGVCSLPDNAGTMLVLDSEQLLVAP